jgi:hypothetical protein
MLRRAQAIASRAINEQGVALYNSGDIAGCANVYANAVVDILSSSPELPANARSVLTSGLDQAGASAGNHDAQAWALRGALDSFISLREQEQSVFSGVPSTSGGNPSLSFADGMAGSFRAINDGVMGGMSQSSIAHSPDHSAAVFSGVLSTANNGGFASVRAPVNWDLTAATKIQISAASPTGGMFQFILHDTTQRRVPCHTQDFTLPADDVFRLYELPLEGFNGDFMGRLVPGARLNRATVVGLTLRAAKITQTGSSNPMFKPGPFSLYVKTIAAV